MDEIQTYSVRKHFFRQAGSPHFLVAILALIIGIFGFVNEGMVLNSMENPTRTQGYATVLRIAYYIKLIGLPLVSVNLLKLGCDVLYKILKRVDPEDGTK